MVDVDVPPATFDGVLLLNVIEHWSDPPAVLDKIKSMLRPVAIGLGPECLIAARAQTSS